MSTNSKDNAISMIRLIALFMIIGCHILQGLNNKWAFWVNVGVQIFFFISGFLYGKKEIKNVKKFYMERIKIILIPYTILFIIMLVLETLILKNYYSWNLIIGSFLGFGGFHGNIKTLSHTWFISYILLCYLFVPLFQKIFKGKILKLISYIVFYCYCLFKCYRSFQLFLLMLVGLIILFWAIFLADAVIEIKKEKFMN